MTGHKSSAVAGTPRSGALDNNPEKKFEFIAMSIIVFFFSSPTSRTQAASFVELVLHKPSARCPKRSRGVPGGGTPPRGNKYKEKKN